MSRSRPVSTILFPWCCQRCWDLSNSANSSDEWLLKVLKDEYETPTLLDLADLDFQGPDGSGGHSYLGGAPALYTRIKT
jgi:hypothetical protein